MDVQRVYKSICGWRVSAEAESAIEEAHVWLQMGSSGASLKIDELDDLLVALHAAKDDLRNLLAKQEYEKELREKSSEEKKK